VVQVLNRYKNEVVLRERLERLKKKGSVDIRTPFSYFLRDLDRA